METFSFLNGLFGANTVRYNLLHVLAMHAGVLPGSAPERGAAKTGAVVAYASGPAAGKAVYDTVSVTSWLLNANLAATESFGVGGTADIPATGNDNAITLPLPAPGGALHVNAAEKWVAGLSSVGYAGGRAWSLPALSDLQRLYADLGLAPGNAALLASGPLRVLPELPALLLLGLPQLLGGAVRLRALPTRSRRDQDEVVLQLRHRFPGDQPGDEAILRPGLSSEALRGSLMPKLSSGPCWVSWWAPSLHTSSTKLPIRRLG